MIGSKGQKEKIRLHETTRSYTPINYRKHTKPF